MIGLKWVNITNIALRSQLAIEPLKYLDTEFSMTCFKAFLEKVVFIQNLLFLPHYNQILQSCQTLQQE